MPPKRGRARRGGGQRGAAAAAPAPQEPEAAEANVEDPNSQLELPSDSATNPEPTAAASESASLTRPAAGSASPAPSISGATAQRGKKLLSQPKFRGRRSQTQLQQIQQAEDERKRAAAEAEAAKEAKKRVNGRGRGRGSDFRGRGRGGYIGEGQRGSESSASGLFGSGQASREDRDEVRGGSSGPSSSRTTRATTSTSSRARGSGKSQPQREAAVSTTKDGKPFKKEPGRSGSKKVKTDNDGDVSMLDPNSSTIEISSDEEDGERRLNVEDLGVIDLTQDEPFAPVRVLRVAHKERAIGINADGATNQDGNITIDANDITTTTSFDQRKGKQKAKEVEIISDTATFQATYSDSESDVERRTKVKRDPDGETVRQRSPDVPRRFQSSSPEAKRKAKERIKAGAALNDLLPSDQDFQTRDELDEWERYQSDVRVLREELGAGMDSDGDATMANADRRAEKVYLFQFPPVLPDLSPIIVKADPEAATNDPEGMQIDQPITIPDDDLKKKTRPQPNLPSGAVGKLKVHASGRVTLDWGGTSLRLGVGARASFLQDILVAQLPESKTSDEQQGLASSMGQVKGKFVVTPDWEEILK